MGVLDGQNVSQAITNPAFINKNTDDVMPNKLGFNRLASGSSIADIQLAVNTLYTATGASETQTGTVYNATAGTITNGDSYETALTTLADKFDAATGHEHTGSPGDAPPIMGSSLASVPLLGYIEQGTTFLAATGTSSDITSLMTGKSASTGPTVLGVCTTSPSNKSRILAASGSASYTDIVDTSGNLVYGRVTFDGTNWALSYFSEQSASETPYAFMTPTELLWWYQELFNPMSAPPVYNPTMGLFTAGGGGAGGGVSSIAASGNTPLTGAVTLSAGAGIALTQTGNDIEISSDGSGLTPTIQKFLSGSGTYTAPTNPAPSYIRVRMVGGGGGGNGDSGATGATDGGDTTFGPATAGGGKCSIVNSDGGLGGTASLGSGPIGIALGGGNGNAGGDGSGFPGGMGGASAFGGTGGGGNSANGNTGSAGVTNTGGGGGGACTSGSDLGGGGGGSGGYVDAIIVSPSSTYSYSVGTGGTHGAGSLTNGFDGGSGIIIIEEYYSGSGGGASSPVVAFRVGNNSSAQNIPSGTLTNVTMTTVDFDTNSAWDGTNTYTIPEDGIYQVSGNFSFNAFGSTTNQVVIQIAKNGSEELRGNTIPKAAGFPVGVGVSGLIQCVTGDTLTMQIYQDSGVNQNPVSDADQTWFCINKVAAASGIGSSSLTTQTTNYSVSTSDDIVLCDTTGGAFTVTLPTAVGIPGKTFTIQKVSSDSNQVTIATTSSQTIWSVTSVKIVRLNDILVVVSDGANWQVQSDRISAEIFGYTYTGLGSVATCVPYFTTVTDNSGGGAFSLVNNSTDGFQVTVNYPGFYQMTVDYAADITFIHGIVLNSNSYSTNILSLTSSTVRTLSNSTSADQVLSVSAMVYCNAGDILNPQCTGDAWTGSLARGRISVCRIGT